MRWTRPVGRSRKMNPDRDAAGRGGPRGLKLGRILVTGAAGQLGGYLARQLSGIFPLLLTDCRALPHAQPHPFLLIELADSYALRRVTSGVDALIHMAGIPTAHASPDRLRVANVDAAASVLSAAREAGCRLVILASSIQVSDGYPAGERIQPDMPLRPTNAYAESKAQMESMARGICSQGGLSVVCLRLGWVRSRWDYWITPGSPFLERMLLPEDFLRAVRAALVWQGGDGFHPFYTLSRNGDARWDPASARSQLGYVARQDARRLAWSNIPGMARRIRRKLIRGTSTAADKELAHE
jgi:uronate dehydrogenase